MSARRASTFVVLALFSAACSDIPVTPQLHEDAHVANLITVSGDNQVRWVGEKLAAFTVRVTDNGVPVVGAPVTWNVTQGSVTLWRKALVTGSDGAAAAYATMPLTAQLITITAEVTGWGTHTFHAGVADGTDIVLDTILVGLSRPVYATAPMGDPRLFIVEQTGRIKILKNGGLLATPFLDLTAKVSTNANERGLFSMAFQPGYSTYGYFFVYYTDLNGDLRIERYHANPGADVADPASAKLVLSIQHPSGNHNGGHLLFGPASMLYIPTGDGGGANDPFGNGQNLNTLLGKLIRIAPSSSGPYRIPTSNPYVGQSGARPEIWASGLRNPWRIAIDRGWLYVADVGQDAREEINLRRLDEPALNYGWSDMEGSLCRIGSCDLSKYTLPLVEYDHSQGCSIIGGFVYRGSALPELVGHYVYSDFCSGWIRSFKLSSGQATIQREWTHLPHLSLVASFGIDGANELYIMGDGRLMKFVRRP